MTATTVGSYEAKTHLPRLLSEVADGESITITKHGVPIARLVPVDDTQVTKGSIEKTRQGLVQFRRGKSLKGLTVKSLVEEGRVG